MFTTGHSILYSVKPEWSAFRNGTQFGHGQIKVIDEQKIEWYDAILTFTIYYFFFQ